MQCVLMEEGDDGEEGSSDIKWLREGELLEYSDTNQVQMPYDDETWLVISTLWYTVHMLYNLKKNMDVNYATRLIAKSWCSFYELYLAGTVARILAQLLATLSFSTDVTGIKQILDIKHNLTDPVQLGLMSLCPICVSVCAQIHYKFLIFSYG